MESKNDPSEMDEELSTHVHSEKLAAERQSFLELTRGLARLPLDQAAAAVEASAAIAGVSLRASLEFLRAVPEATTVLSAAELRSWGELGRRITMSDTEAGVSFFIAGVAELKELPEQTLPLIFQIFSRQMTLSPSIAQRTFERIPSLAKAINNTEVTTSLLEIAAEISRRSAKHSADFLDAAPRVISSLRGFADSRVTQQALILTSFFASRAGGISADAWSALPVALKDLSTTDALKLLNRTEELLERGGGVALHTLVAGAEILRLLPELFDNWIELLMVVADHGNATLVAFIRNSPRFFRLLAVDSNRERALEICLRVTQLTKEIAQTDSEAALACFRSSTHIRKSVTLDQFEDWARRGLSEKSTDQRARRSYFALETRSSHDMLVQSGQGTSLESVQHLLKLYIEALTGREVEITHLASVPDESRINDGRTIHLPSMVNEFNDTECDFRLYKVLAAHAAGQIEFGTNESNSSDIRAAYAAIASEYDPTNQDARDAFALDGYLSDSQKAGTQQPAKGNRPGHIDHRTILQLFPYSTLARRIFGTLENGRIDRRLGRKYRGLSRDLDLIREHLRKRRPAIVTLPAALVPFELLFQVTLLGGALDDSREYYRQVVSELETIVADYLSLPETGVADSLMATSRVYRLFQSISQNDDSTQQVETQEEQADQDEENEMASERLRTKRGERAPEKRDARELFNAWNDPGNDGEPDDLQGAESWMDAQTPEQSLEEGEVAYNYDEWDRELTDHRMGWCRVIEKHVKTGNRDFVEQTRERYKGVISSIRYQFQLLKPEDLTRVSNEFDGEEFDLDSVIDHVIDRRADGQQSERLYIKRLRRRRDVAVSFLLDQSSSTARTIGRHPLQPYTRPGRRIIEIEKEGLVLMSEALEAVGDVYSINGFTSEGRRNVKFYVVKDFKEQYSDEVKRRIGGITYQNNTRLGAAIRHATARLSKQEARTRLLIVLSDGRPYDHDYGDARYAREDTREALRQAKIQGITPFCITIDRESEAELRDLYGEIGYTIIDDVLSLPERMPAIYRRLTT
ncbi:MAG TPA: VWA domain-containing protein [Pyrinomonadaceae bacterium]